MGVGRRLLGGMGDDGGGKDGGQVGMRGGMERGDSGSIKEQGKGCSRSNTVD